MNFIDISALKRSIVHAWRGWRVAFRGERSFRIQTAAGLLVIALAIMLPLAFWQRALLFVVIAFVLVLELINSSVERLIDLIRPRLDERARDAKDLLAGAVLLASLAAAIVGLMILGPSLFLQIVRL